MRFRSEKPVAVLYEHPRWFNPLFHVLEDRGISVVKLSTQDHVYDPAERTIPFGLLYNDMSFPLWQEDAYKVIADKVSYLQHVHGTGVQVINGADAVNIAHSRVRQLSIFKSLGLDFPATRVVHNQEDILSHAKTLGFPLMVKRNTGVVSNSKYFATWGELAAELAVGNLSVDDGRAIVLQRVIPPKGDHIIRAETLNGKFLYALKVYGVGEAYSLRAPEVFAPSAEVIDAVENVVRYARVDVGSVTYVTDRRSNKSYFLGINAYPDYSIEVRNALGYDPYAGFVDYMEHRLRKIREIELAL